MAIQFHRPESLKEALQLKQDLGEDARFLAGGTELNDPAHRTRARHLIWLGRLGLDAIDETADGLSIGACATLQQVVDSALVPPALQAAARHLVNRNLRNVATVGGNIGSGRGVSFLGPALLAAHAMVVVATAAGTERMALEDFQARHREDLIVAVRIPWLVPSRQVAVLREARSANDVSVVTAAASLWRDGDVARDIVLAIGGAGPRVARIRAVERALEGRALPAAEEMERLIAANVRPTGDLRGSAAYRQRLAAVVGARVLRAAWKDEEAH